MKSIIRIAHIVVNGRKVCQLERVVSRRANRAFALNSRKPALTPGVFSACCKAALTA